MRLLTNYFVADNTSEIELDKMVEQMIAIGYERIGEPILKPVSETTTIIYMQPMGQFKEVL